MASLIDCMHLDRDRVIGAWEVAPGVIVDPGPASCVEALLAGVSEQPRALLLTHIHLDHAGASGVLARRFPELRVHVHEDGAPHMIDPVRLVKSAGRLYGSELEHLWGEVAPVPAERVVPLRGGERAEGLAVVHTPGHAAHHVVYFDAVSGDAYTGDVAGVRVPPGELVAAPTPPPEIDLEAWRGSVRRLRELAPRRLCMTHFGASENAEAHLDRLEAWLAEAAERSESGDGAAFGAWLAERFEAEGGDVAARLRQAMPPDQLWLGLERYWRKRRERESA